MTVSSVIVTDLVPLRDRGVYQGMSRLSVVSDSVVRVEMRLTDGRYHDDCVWSGDVNWWTISRLVKRSSWLGMVFLDPSKYQRHNLIIE